MLLLSTIAALAVSPILVLWLQNNFPFYPTSLESILRKFFIPRKFIGFGEGMQYLGTEFHEANFKFCCIYSLLLSMIMSAVFFAAMNFSAEKKENDENATQQTLPYQVLLFVYA